MAERTPALEALDRAYAELNDRAMPLSDAAYTEFGYIAAGWWPQVREALSGTESAHPRGDEGEVKRWERRLDSAMSKAVYNPTEARVAFEEYRRYVHAALAQRGTGVQP